MATKTWQLTFVGWFPPAVQLSETIHFCSVLILRSSVSNKQCLSTGQSMTAMEMLSRAALSYCHVGKNEGAACRSLLTLCKWLLADWKDMTSQLKQACSPKALHLLFTLVWILTWHGITKVVIGTNAMSDFEAFAPFFLFYKSYKVLRCHIFLTQ